MDNSNKNNEKIYTVLLLIDNKFIKIAKIAYHSNPAFASIPRWPTKT